MYIGHCGDMFIFPLSVIDQKLIQFVGTIYFDYSKMKKQVQGMWERFSIRLSRSTLSHSTLSSQPKGSSQATAKSNAAAGSRFH